MAAEDGFALGALVGFLVGFLVGTGIRGVGFGDAVGLAEMTAVGASDAASDGIAVALGEGATLGLPDMEGVLEIGEAIKVKLIEVDKKSGKYRLSRKVLLPRDARPAPQGAEA